MSYDAVANGKLDTLLAAGSGPPKLLGAGYQTYPTAAASVSMGASVTAWANPAWTQIWASTPEAIYVTGLQIVSQAAAADWEIDLATGISGSEVVVGTIPFTAVTAAGMVVPVFFPALIPVASGIRIAARPRQSGTSGYAISIRLIYIQQANL